LNYHSGDVVADAERFHASAEFQEVVQRLGTLGKPEGKGYRLLDVGCGNGIACCAFARKGYEVTGIDISEGQIAGLQAARSLIGRDGAQFRVLNTNMEKAALTETFDVIYMRQALHHSSDPASTVQELSRLLSPGGIFCVTREHVVRNERQRRRFLVAHPFHHITQDEHAYTLATYRDAFRRAELAMRIELFPYDSEINFYPGSHRSLVRHLGSSIGIDLGRHLRLQRLMLRILAYKHQLAREMMYSFFCQKAAS
jgi:2-polyprenyl-3-methyl-5-hydroxy-6-metoxy-1,4-benzoquinol methylase